MTSASHLADMDQKLRASRTELLDIGLRNNLINFRKTSKNLAAQNASAELLLHAFVDEGRALPWVATGKVRGDAAAGLEETLLISLQEANSGQDSTGDLEVPMGKAATLLLPAPEPSPAATPAVAEPVDTPVPRPRTKPALYSAMAPEPMFLQLLKIRAESQTLLEEQGANLLFLAVGFLHWYEADSAQQARHAPLIMLPCTLAREGASEQFELRPSGDDPVLNLSLAAKLKTDFGIVLPELDSISNTIDADGGLDMAAQDWLRYLSAVRQAVASQPRWQVVADEVVLGFFSFGKFLMFKDLASETWPADQSPAKHPVMRRLLSDGFGDEPAAYAEDVHIDAVIAAGEVHFVKDADSSQTQALLEARSGRNLVIQGPPGTGKSQTITNLIAELLAQQKTVLFVSEKMAALEVVKRRLDECQLGDAVLELHSHRATKAAVLKELGRTLESPAADGDDGRRSLGQLQTTQHALNAYCDAVSEPIGHSGQDFAAALGNCLQQQAQHPSLQALVWPALAELTPEQIAVLEDWVQRAALVVQSLGRPDASPFLGSTLSHFSPLEEAQVRRTLTQLQSAVAQLQSGGAQLAQRLQLDTPTTLPELAVLSRTARRAAEAPPLGGATLNTAHWVQQRDAIHALLSAGSAMHALRQQRSELIEQAWRQDVLASRQAVAALGGNWWKFLSGRWRNARTQLQGLLKTPADLTPEHMLRMADDILAWQQQHSVYQQHAALGQALFGAQWQAETSDWGALNRLSLWAMGVHDEVNQGHLPRSMLGFLAGQPDVRGLGDVATALGEQAQRITHTLAEATAQIGLPHTPEHAAPLHTQPLADQLAQLTRWEAQLPLLHHTARLNALIAQAGPLGLGPMLPSVMCCEQPEQLLPLLHLSHAQALVQRAYQSHPELAQFDRHEHEHRIAQFRRLDQDSLAQAQTRLARTLWQRRPKLGQAGEMAVLRHELNKKRRHIPIRQLIRRAGRSIQQFKPVFMMSPLSIANFLPPGELSFDVVIFDEASQVKAVDALGAILRGKQVIVVGDTRQMPPTDFFSREVETEDDTDTSDIESILSLFKAKGCNERYLRWHYRSRHESLIAVSNAEFYDNRLVIFPTAGSEPDAVGISHTHLPHALYDRGRTRTNPVEARAVADAIMEHAQTKPHLTLGVAAFSVAQRDLIEVELELLRRLNDAGEAFFSQHPNEPFFVKNLENIQGDERDVMFISIGYGRNESGKIAREFGPLNRDGGHRRLNVLITRAKRAMRIFSNFRGDELALDGSAKHGVRALKNLLTYAETRQLAVATETGKATDSPFEDQVLAALRARGYQMEPQVGTAGYFIDMAVRDPELPGRYVLAIECDGAAYHSSRSARDRDRLRQSVLEGLGWRFHRIWSTDWFRNPAQETERTVQAIEAARSALHARSQTQAPTPSPAPSASPANADSSGSSSAIIDADDSSTAIPRTDADADANAASPPKPVLALAAAQETASTPAPEPVFTVDARGAATAVASNAAHSAEPGALGIAPDFLDSQPLLPSDLGDLWNLEQAIDPVALGHVQPYPASVLPRQHHDFAQADEATLDALLLQAVQQEAPMHAEVLLRRLMAAFGASRPESDLVTRFTEAVRRQGMRQRWQVSQGFIHTEAQHRSPLQVPLRDRSALPPHERKLAWVSPLELRAAVFKVVQLSAPPHGDTAAHTAAHWLGLDPADAPTLAALQAQCQVLLQGGVLQSSSNGHLSVAAPHATS